MTAKPSCLKLASVLVAGANDRHTKHDKTSAPRRIQQQAYIFNSDTFSQGDWGELLEKHLHTLLKHFLLSFNLQVKRPGLRSPPSFMGIGPIRISRETKENAGQEPYNKEMVSLPSWSSGMRIASADDPLYPNRPSRN